MVVGGGAGGVGDGCFHWNRLLGDGFGSPKLFDLPKKLILGVTKKLRGITKNLEE